MILLMLLLISIYENLKCGLDQDVFDAFAHFYLEKLYKVV
jgi:hypothetical protein